MQRLASRLKFGDFGEPLSEKRSGSDTQAVQFLKIAQKNESKRIELAKELALIRNTICPENKCSAGPLYKQQVTFSNLGESVNIRQPIFHSTINDVGHGITRSIRDSSEVSSIAESMIPQEDYFYEDQRDIERVESSLKVVHCRPCMNGIPGRVCNRDYIEENPEFNTGNLALSNADSPCKNVGMDMENQYRGYKKQNSIQSGETYARPRQDIPNDKAQIVNNNNTKYPDGLKQFQRLAGYNFLLDSRDTESFSMEETPPGLMKTFDKGKVLQTTACNTHEVAHKGVIAKPGILIEVKTPKHFKNFIIPNARNKARRLTLMNRLSGKLRDSGNPEEDESKSEASGSSKTDSSGVKSVPTENVEKFCDLEFDKNFETSSKPCSCTTDESHADSNHIVYTKHDTSCDAIKSEISNEVSHHQFDKMNNRTEDSLAPTIPERKYSSDYIDDVLEEAIRKKSRKSFNVDFKGHVCGTCLAASKLENLQRERKLKNGNTTNSNNGFVTTLCLEPDSNHNGCVCPCPSEATDRNVRRVDVCTAPPRLTFGTCFCSSIVMGSSNELPRNFEEFDRLVDVGDNVAVVEGAFGDGRRHGIQTKKSCSSKRSRGTSEGYVSCGMDDGRRDSNLTHCACCCIGADRRNGCTSENRFTRSQKMTRNRLSLCGGDACECLNCLTRPHSSDCECSCEIDSAASERSEDDAHNNPLFKRLKSPARCRFKRNEAGAVSEDQNVFESPPLSLNRADHLKCFYDSAEGSSAGWLTEDNANNNNESMSPARKNDLKDNSSQTTNDCGCTNTSKRQLHDVQSCCNSICHGEIQSIAELLVRLEGCMLSSQVSHVRHNFRDPNENQKSLSGQAYENVCVGYSREENFESATRRSAIKPGTENENADLTFNDNLHALMKAHSVPATPRYPSNAHGAEPINIESWNAGNLPGTFQFGIYAGCDIKRKSFRGYAKKCKRRRLRCCSLPSSLSSSPRYSRLTREEIEKKLSKGGCEKDIESKRISLDGVNSAAPKSEVVEPALLCSADYQINHTPEVMAHSPTKRLEQHVKRDEIRYFLLSELERLRETLKQERLSFIAELMATRQQMIDYELNQKNKMECLEKSVCQRLEWYDQLVRSRSAALDNATEGSSASLRDDDSTTSSHGLDTANEDQIDDKPPYETLANDELLPPQGLFQRMSAAHVDSSSANVYIQNNEAKDLIDLGEIRKDASSEKVHESSCSRSSTSANIPALNDVKIFSNSFKTRFSDAPVRPLRMSLGASDTEAQNNYYSSNETNNSQSGNREAKPLSGRIHGCLFKALHTTITGTSAFEDGWPRHLQSGQGAFPEPLMSGKREPNRKLAMEKEVFFPGDPGGVEQSKMIRQLRIRLTPDSTSRGNQEQASDAPDLSNTASFARPVCLSSSGKDAPPPNNGGPCGGMGGTRAVEGSGHSRDRLLPCEPLSPKNEKAFGSSARRENEPPRSVPTHQSDSLVLPLVCKTRAGFGQVGRPSPSFPSRTSRLTNNNAAYGGKSINTCFSRWTMM